MEESKKNNIHLLFDELPEEVSNLAERLGESAPNFADNIEKIQDKTPTIVIQSEKSIPWHESLAGVVHPAHLGHPALEYLIRRSHEGSFSVDMNESYEEFEKEVYAYRFIDPFEEGEIGDVMAQKILEAGFDPLPFRSFHTSLMGYVAHHVKRGNFLLPIDIQLGIFQGSIVIQCAVSSRLFTQEHIKESFGATDIKSPYTSLLRQSYENCHILDIQNVESAKKVILTGVWCHDQYGLPGGSLLFRTVKTLKTNVDRAQKSNELNLLFAKHESQFSDLKFSGATARRYGPDEFIETDHPYIVELVVQHCQKVLDESGEKAPAESEGLVALLQDFADKSLLAKLNAIDWKNALRALQDVSTRELLQASVEHLSHDTDDEVFERVIDTLSHMSFDEAKTVVSGKVEEDEFKQIIAGSIEEDDYLNVIPGIKEDLTEATTMVKGKREDVGSNKDKTVIKGSGDPFAGKGEFNNRLSSAWEDKKKGILNKVKEKWAIAKSNGATGADLEHEMRLVMKEQMGVDEEVADQLVRGVVGESRDEVISQHVRDRAQEMRSKMQEERFKQELAKRDQQIFRMKKIMDQVKTEMNKKQAPVAAPELSQATIQNDQDNVLLQQELSRVSQELLSATQELAGKDRETQREIELKEKHIADLENKLDYYRERSNGEKENQAELSGLKRENTSLQNQSQLQQSRVEQMAERMAKQKQDFENRDRAEADKAKERLAFLESERQKTKDQLTRLEFMNREMEKKLVDKENELMRLRQAQGESDASVAMDRLKEAQKEVDEYKVKEREQQQEVKAQMLKVRQLEQKLKFAMAQLDKQSSKAAAAAASNSSSANEKRLEKINQKLSEGMKAQAAEVAERRKEVMKLKAESNTQAHKIKELERALSKYGKAS